MVMVWAHRDPPASAATPNNMAIPFVNLLTKSGIILNTSLRREMVAWRTVLANTLTHFLNLATLFSLSCA
jgi:hypothetical protein